MAHNIRKKEIFSTPDNPSLAHQELVSDVMYEPPTKKICSLNAAIINEANNGNSVAKIMMTQEEGSVDYSTTHKEEEF